jgi:glutamine synthetase
MREEGGEEYFNNIFRSFDVRHQEHIQNYGSENNLRLTGKHETQSIDKFSWGVSDRGASIRVPLATSKEWKGYVEDRRPASNGDPYKIVRVISEALDFAIHIDKINHTMNTPIDVEKAKEALAYLGINLSQYKQHYTEELDEIEKLGSKE